MENAGVTVNAIIAVTATKMPGKFAIQNTKIAVALIRQWKIVLVAKNACALQTQACAQENKRGTFVMQLEETVNLGVAITLAGAVGAEIANKKAEKNVTDQIPQTVSETKKTEAKSPVLQTARAKKDRSHAVFAYWILCKQNHASLTK